MNRGGLGGCDVVWHGGGVARGIGREEDGWGGVGDDSGEYDGAEGVKERGLVERMPRKCVWVGVVEVDDGVEDDSHTAVVVVGLGNGLLVDYGVWAERRVGGIVVVEEVEPCV